MKIDNVTSQHIWLYIGLLLEKSIAGVEEVKLETHSRQSPDLFVRHRRLRAPFSVRTRKRSCI